MSPKKILIDCPRIYKTFAYFFIIQGNKYAILMKNKKKNK